MFAPHIASSGLKGTITSSLDSNEAKSPMRGTTDGGTIDRTGTKAYIQFEFTGAYEEYVQKQRGFSKLLTT
jgi:hypothetical protein